MNGGGAKEGGGVIKSITSPAITDNAAWRVLPSPRGWIVGAREMPNEVTWPPEEAMFHALGKNAFNFKQA